MKSDSERYFRRPESVLVVIHTTDDKTLLLKRTPPQSFWQSVTGSMMWEGESKLQTAIRELREETGIVAKPRELRDWKRTFKFKIPQTIQHRYEEGVQFNREHVFSVLLPGIKPVELQQNEHIEYRWADFRTAQELVWSWSNREALEMVVSCRNQVSSS